MKAITSTKLSPSNKCCMIGFGVRTEGVVYGHAQSDVACEIITLADMRTTCTLTDSEDEVNIAQFHPVPGNGILYGTKKGRIRKYQRSGQLHW
jgi:activating molecule in BECN1-regulated autophagy protein 1